MTENPQVNQAQPQENKPNDKELNFRALEAKYEKQLAQERAYRQELEKQIHDVQNKIQNSDDDDDSEPYVDHKRLDKRLSSFERKMEEKIDKKAEEKARLLLERERQETWLKRNNDFNEVMTQQNMEKFYNHDPELAETILQMPDGFERQKLVYKNIKALGIDKPPQKAPSIQEKIEANRKSPYYQPSGVGTAPYSSVGDFSPTGQKQAYEKMQELKSRLRI